MKDSENIITASDGIIQNLEEINQLSKQFQEGVSFSPPISQLLNELHAGYYLFLSHGKSIEEILQDNIISPFEYDKIVTHISAIEEQSRKLFEKHNEIKYTINIIVDIINFCGRMLEKIRYVTDVGWVLGRPDPDFSSGYSVSSSYYTKLVEELNKLLIGKIDKKTQQTTILEQLITQLAKLVGYLKEWTVFDIIYRLEPQFFTTITEIRKQLKYQLMPIYDMINEDYYKKQIDDARKGLELLSNKEELRIGNNIKIRGAFGIKKGAAELADLARKLWPHDPDI